MPNSMSLMWSFLSNFRMSPSQQLMVVPGTFACSNLSYVPLDAADSSGWYPMGFFGNSHALVSAIHSLVSACVPSPFEIRSALNYNVLVHFCEKKNGIWHSLSFVLCYVGGVLWVTDFAKRDSYVEEKQKCPQKRCPSRYVCDLRSMRCAAMFNPCTRLLHFCQCSVAQCTKFTCSLISNTYS